MKVVHVNFDANPCGGATIAMLRLHRAMREIGIDSWIACCVRPEDVHAVALRIPMWNRCMIFGGKVLMRLISGACQSHGLVPSGMANFINRMKPDAVVLHWLQTDTMAVQEIAQIKAPVYWMHHDRWPIRGLTAHPWFEVPHRLGWLDRLAHWNKCRVAFAMGSRLTPVCASQWMAKEIMKSRVFAGREPEVIPLPLDPCYKPGERNPSRCFRILFGAIFGMKNSIKGGDRLLSALKRLPVEMTRQMELVVFGQEGGDEAVNAIPIHYVGRKEGEELAQLYRDADMFAFPSRQETYGQTKMEALACGTPVIAFDETACADGVEHKVNGWVASANDIENYAAGIRYFFEAWRCEKAIRVSDARAKYEGRTVVEMWMRLFQRSVNC